MENPADRESAAEAMNRINRAWLDGRAGDLAELFHPSIVMVFPGFGGRAEGRDAAVAGFEDFCTQAKIHDYREDNHHADVAGDTAVVGFTYAMVYERDGSRYRATGRDLWVFTRQDTRWLATWRAMLEIDEQPA